MKKKLSILLSFILLIVFMLPSRAFALDNKELEKAISTAKSLLNISDEFDTFSYGMSKQDDITVYSLSWNDSKNTLGSINVNIDSTGRITSYYSYTPYDGRRGIKLPSISKNDAKKIADDFVKKVNPSAFAKVNYVEDTNAMFINDYYYHFYYERIENGVPFPANNINVSVDNRSGTVTSFYCNWTDGIAFPDLNGVISMDKAQQIFTDKLGLKLLYKLSYYTDEAEPYLAYSLVESNKGIDAKTGEVTSLGGIYYRSQKPAGKLEETAMDNGNYSRLSPEEQKAVDSSANLIDETKAENIVRNILELDKDYKLESINLYKVWQTKNEYVWNMYFTKEIKEGEYPQYFTASASLNAKTGEITDFYRPVQQDYDAEVKYNKEQAYKLAEDFIKSMQPKEANQVEYTEWGQPEVIPYEKEQAPRNFNFVFTRVSNGVYFPGNGFNINIDTTTGTIIGYNFTWYKEDLPLPNNIISLTQAHKILFDKIGLQLQYIADYSKESDMLIKTGGVQSIKPNIKLVYMLKNTKPSNIDAVNGEILDYSGKPYVERTIANYNDVSGHTAENAIRTLAMYGISLPGSQFKPGQIISQREFLYMLAVSMGWYQDFEETDAFDNNLYSYMTSSGVIKQGEKNPAAIVSKQEASRFVVRALNYEKIAELKSLFNLPFKDSSSISDNFYGYTAIAYGLGIVNDDNGYFKPLESTTRAETAKYLYNLLSLGLNN